MIWSVSSWIDRKEFCGVEYSSNNKCNYCENQKQLFAVIVCEISVSCGNRKFCRVTHLVDFWSNKKYFSLYLLCVFPTESPKINIFLREFNCQFVSTSILLRISWNGMGNIFTSEIEKERRSKMESRITRVITANGVLNKIYHKKTFITGTFIITDCRY